jgi:hypothetical protein
MTLDLRHTNSSYSSGADTIPMIYHGHVELIYSINAKAADSNKNADRILNRIYSWNWSMEPLGKRRASEEMQKALGRNQSKTAKCHR